MKKFLSTLLSLTILLVTLTACSSKEDEEIPHTLDEILTIFSNDTQLDDLMKIGDDFTIETDSFVGTEDKSFMECVEQLETYMEFINKLEEQSIFPIAAASEEIIDEYDSYTDEDISILINSLSTDDSLTDIQIARIKGGLAYISSKKEAWIVGNGLPIAEELLKRIIKASICEISGLEIEYYKSCKILKEINDPETGNVSQVNVTDPISGATMVYTININDHPELSDAVQKIYDIQEMSDEEKQDPTIVKNACADALNKTKIAVATGVQYNEDHEIVANQSKKEAIQKIKKITN